MDLSYSSLHTMRSIIASTITDEGLIAIDSTPILYRFSPKGVFTKHSTMKGIRSYPNRYAKSITLTQDGKFGVVCDHPNHRALFVSIHPLKLLSILPFFQAEVAVFSHDDRYFAIGSAEGRLKMYETLECKTVAEIHLADGIVSLSFSPDNALIAVGTMDKKIHIVRLSRPTIIQTFRLDEIIEAISFGADGNKLVAFARSGATHVMNIALKQRFLGDPMMEWPTHIVSAKSRHIALVGSRSNELFIYNNSDGIQLGSLRFDYWGITSLCTSTDTVFVGFSDGNGHLIDLKEPIREAIDALEASDISKLSIVAFATPLILINPELCVKIEQSYEPIFAFRPTSSDERKGYEILISLMIADSAIRKELIRTLYTSEDIAPFMEEISSGNIQKACIKVYKAPLLRQLREFNEVRSNCLSDLTQEIKLLETDSAKFKEYVESAPPQCTGCVHNIIPAPEALAESYQKLLSSAAAKNYSAVMEITDQYPMLRQTKVYRRLMNYGEALIDKIRMMITAGKIDEADLYAAKLSQIKPFALSGIDFKNQIKAYDAFENAAKTDNVVKVFAMAMEFPVLRTTEMFRHHLELYQKNILLPAHPLIQNGEVSKLRTLIGVYGSVEYFEEKNLLLIKKGLLQEIKLYAPLGEEQNLLDRYHACFGWDREYAAVCNVLKCTPNHHSKLDPPTEECKQINTFLTGERVMRQIESLKENRAHG